MRSQDEEYSKAVAEPGEGVQEVDPSTHQHNFLELKKGWAQEILELGEGVNCELSKTTRLILLDSLLQETVHVVPSLYLQEPTGKTKIKMAESRRMEEWTEQYQPDNLRRDGGSGEKNPEVIDRLNWSAQQEIRTPVVIGKQDQSEYSTNTVQIQCHTVVQI